MPDRLREVGLNIEVHADHFKHDAPDTEWLRACGDKNWVVLAKDKAITKNPLERHAVFSCKLAAFFLTRGEKTGQDNAAAIIKGLKKIANLLENQRRPFIARIHLDGKVELWLNHKGKDFIARKYPKRVEPT